METLLVPSVGKLYTMLICGRLPSNIFLVEERYISSRLLKCIDIIMTTDHSYITPCYLHAALTRQHEEMTGRVDTSNIMLLISVQYVNHPRYMLF